MKMERNGFNVFPRVFLCVTLISKSLSVPIQCDIENSIDITGGTHLSNGDIFYKGVKFGKRDYYLDKESGRERGCLCKKQPCARKCCPFGSGYDMIQKKCVNVSDVFDPDVWDNYRLVRGVSAVQRFHFLYGKPNCTLPEYRIRIGQLYPDMHLKMDGHLHIEAPGLIPPWIDRGPDKYCIDTVIFEDKAGNKASKLDALICFQANQDQTDTYSISITCMLVSCVFILATVAVYSWLPELRNLHGRVLMAYLLCLFVGFLFMSTMQILLLFNNITPTCCVWMTFVIYFFLLSAFFWLNVMCFDIWWTFSGKRGLSDKLLTTRARFCAYAAYAFGVPTALTVVLAGLEFSGMPKHPLMPNLVYSGCFLTGNAKLMYLYGPIVILCAANMVFFILTALKIAQINHQTSVLKSKDSSTHDQHRNDKQRLLLYVKLFIVMGVNWLLEVFSALYPHDLWKYTDAYNVLIGLIIFIIFVCKRKILRLIKKRYRQLRGDPIMSRTQTVSSRTASSRDDIRLSSLKANPLNSG